MSDAFSHLDSARVDLTNLNFISCKLLLKPAKKSLLLIIIIAIVAITTVIL